MSSWADRHIVESTVRYENQNAKGVPKDPPPPEPESSDED